MPTDPVQEPSVVIIGTGRAAYHIGHAFVQAGIAVKGIVGRDEGRTAVLAEELGTTAFAFGSELPVVDVILIAVSDDAIQEVAAQLPEGPYVVAHISGASSMDQLAPHVDRAVLWPVMTLSPGTPMDLAQVPVVVDALTDKARERITQLASMISERVSELGEGDRELVHTAAAISTNLPLFLLREAEDLLRAQQIDPTLLMPSFVAMAERASTLGASDALTGPARRGDLGTLNRHLERLEEEPELRRAYHGISRMILRAYGRPEDGLQDL